MRKQIEIGCSALVVDGTVVNQGAIITVVDRVGRLKFMPIDAPPYFATGWKVSPAVMGDSGRPVSVVSERQLRRIDDDGDVNTTVSWDSMEGIWQPEALKEAVA